MDLVKNVARAALDRADTYERFRNEGFLIQGCLWSGLAALRRGDSSCRHFLYVGFLNYASAVERIWKLLLIMDHSIRNAGAFPNDRAIRAYGHDLLKLRTLACRLPQTYDVKLSRSLEPDDLDHRFIAFFSEFAKKTRYFNLDALTGAPAATACGSPLFSVADLTNLPSLASKLESPARPFDTWLVDQLSAETKAALAHYQPATSDQAPLQAALLQDLNTILKASSIYDQQRFAGVDLRQLTADLLSKNPRGDDLLRLNRLLIEDAFPLEVARNPACDDPLGTWGALVRDVYSRDVPESARRRSETEVAEHVRRTQAKTIMLSQLRGLDGDQQTYEEACHDHGRMQVASPYAVWRLVKLLIPYKATMVRIRDKLNDVLRPTAAASIPAMEEFLDVVCPSQETVLGDEMWSVW